METEESAKRIEEFHTEGAQNRQKLIELDQENERYLVKYILMRIYPMYSKQGYFIGISPCNFMNYVPQL